MIKIVRLILCTTAVALTGCAHLPHPSFLQNRDKSYLEAKSIPPLIIPNGVSSAKIEDYYPVTNQTYPTSMTDISLVPPGLSKS
jgi:uncharacterized lipoprotein